MKKIWVQNLIKDNLTGLHMQQVNDWKLSIDHYH